MILVWMPVFNEAKNLEKAIASVLAQSFSDFELIISDNYSTDGSGVIIDAAVKADPRVRKVSPPTHMAALDHVRYIYDKVLGKEKFNKYSIFIGGHDQWKRDLLQSLWWRAEAEPDAAIVYADSYEVDDANTVIKQFCGWVQAKAIARPFIPHHILLGLTHNIVWGGLWREDKRRQVEYRYSCAGADHLMIAEMGLLGGIIYQPGSAVYLGRSAIYAEGMESYAKKHIPESIRKEPLLDFANQLEWVSHLADRATEGHAFFGQGPAKDMLKSSLLTAYVCRYWENLQGFPGGFDAFFNHPKIRAIMGADALAVTMYQEFQAEVRSQLQS